jgi:hypothetical protein
MTHTQACDVATEHAQNWRRRWPGHCQHCGARGQIEFDQAHPYGATTATETLAEDCPQCLQAGRCPRCGKEAMRQGLLSSYSISGAVGGEVTESFEYVQADAQTCLACHWDGKPGDVAPYDPKSEPQCCEAAVCGICGKPIDTAEICADCAGDDGIDPKDRANWSGWRTL